MRLTTGEVISYDNKIKLGYNHKKERRQKYRLQTLFQMSFLCFDDANLRHKNEVTNKKMLITIFKEVQIKFRGSWRISRK